MSGPSRTPWFRNGLGLVQGATRLFGSGAILFEAHNLFLRYYGREWSGMLVAGVNGCAGTDMVANGDLLEGQTFCNQPENFVPWVLLYRRHWVAALIYYGVALALILVIGLIWSRLARSATATPFGGPPAPVSPADHEHLR